MTLREIVDQLAQLAGADWYMDYDKNLHFFLAEDATAPFSLSESPNLTTSYPFYNLQKITDGSGVVNRVEIVGGNYLSDDVTIYLQGTGEEATVSLPFKMRGPEAGGGIQVSRNDGTVGTPSWTAMTVKVGYIDDLGGVTEVLHYYQEQVLEQQNSWPELANAVRVFGRLEIPLRTRVTDIASYEFYGLGQWFDAVISDVDITDKNTARLRGKALLAEEAMGRTAVKCKTRKPGLQSGMMIPVVTPLHGIDQSFLIREVSAIVGIDGATDFSLELGIVDEDLIDIMMTLIRGSKEKPIWREDEVLDELLDFAESFEFNTEVTDVSGRNPSANPYKWGADADVLIWSYGKWQS